MFQFSHLAVQVSPLVLLVGAGCLGDEDMHVRQQHPARVWRGCSEQECDREERVLAVCALSVVRKAMYKHRRGTIGSKYNRLTCC